MLDSVSLLEIEKILEDATTIVASNSNDQIERVFTNKDDAIGNLSYDRSRYASFHLFNKKGRLSHVIRIIWKQNEAFDYVYKFSEIEEM